MKPSMSQMRLKMMRAPMEAPAMMRSANELEVIVWCFFSLLLQNYED